MSIYYSPRSRSSHPVLVPDAHAIGMIGVIRSLGRSGYTVHACANQADALGLRSNFAAKGTISPSYEDPYFLEWLDDYVKKNDIRAIVPSEGFLIAIRPAFSRFVSLLPIPRDEAVVYGCLSKASVLKTLIANQETAANIPPTVIWEQGMPLPSISSLRKLNTPLFVKGDGTDDMEAGTNLVSREESHSAALGRMEQISSRYRRILVQGFVPGQGTGAYFLIHRGEIVQEFMNRCLHEVPHTGGFCSLRESWQHPEMMEDARKKIRALGWEGVAMLEYRWDPISNKFWFIEINARFWAALHLSLYAGIDFPTMLLDLHRGETPHASRSFEPGLQCRYTVPSEIGYVVSRWKDPAVPLVSKFASVAGWIARFFDPRIYSDLYFPGDRKLYFDQWGSFIAGALKNITQGK
jgi:ATP-grasp in the biosynthetic pathway with Ter operon